MKKDKITLLQEITLDCDNNLIREKQFALILDIVGAYEDGYNKEGDFSKLAKNRQEYYLKKDYLMVSFKEGAFQAAEESNRNFN